MGAPKGNTNAKGNPGNPNGSPPMGNTNRLKFKEEYIKEADVYLKKNRDRNIKILKQKNDEKGYSMYENKLKVKLPTIYGFATYLGVTEKTLQNWGNNNKEFRIALDKIKNEQKQRLINSGLAGDYNSTIAKLILSSDHGMKERTDNTSGDKPINNFNDEQIDRIAERINRGKGDDGDTSSSEKSN
jgi:hypothetical protein